MTLGIAFWIAGFSQFLVSWLFFRLPGQKLWVLAPTPITRASAFLKPAGVALWVNGLIFMWLGVALMIAVPLLLLRHGT